MRVAVLLGIVYLCVVLTLSAALAETSHSAVHTTKEKAVNDAHHHSLIDDSTHDHIKDKNAPSMVATPPGFVSETTKKEGSELPLAGGLVNAHSSATTEVADPFKLTTLNDFISKLEVDYLINLVNTLTVTRSTTIDGISEHRTSSQFNVQNDPIAIQIQSRLASYLGINSTELESGGILRYEVGQQFRAHYDGVRDESDGAYYRPYSILVYLNDMTSDDGGATSFPTINRIIQPKCGMAVMWPNYMWDPNNMKYIIDPRSLHAGEPIVRGTKFVMVWWSHPTGFVATPPGFVVSSSTVSSRGPPSAPGSPGAPGAPGAPSSFVATPPGAPGAPSYIYVSTPPGFVATPPGFVATPPGFFVSTPTRFVSSPPGPPGAPSYIYGSSFVATPPGFVAAAPGAPGYGSYGAPSSYVATPPGFVATPPGFVAETTASITTREVGNIDTNEVTKEDKSVHHESASLSTSINDNNNKEAEKAQLTSNVHVKGKSGVKGSGSNDGKPSAIHSSKFNRLQMAAAAHASTKAST